MFEQRNKNENTLGIGGNELGETLRGSPLRRSSEDARTFDTDVD